MPAKTSGRKKLRFTIARKASLGYVVLLTLLFLTSAISLLSLVKLDAINRSIIRSDIPVVNAADRLIDILLGEEHYARRHRILKTPEIQGVFREKGAEFDRVLGEIRDVAEQGNLPVAEIDLIHGEYRRMLTQWVEGRHVPGKREITDPEIRSQQEQLVKEIKEMADRARTAHNDKTEQIALISSMAIQVAAAFCGIGLVIALLAALIITRNISGTIEKLKLAASRIVQSDFSNIPAIKQKDELGAVAVAFIGMAKRLRYLEDRNRKVRIEEAEATQVQREQAETVPFAGEPGPSAADVQPAETVPEVSSSDVRQITGLPAGKAVMEGLRSRLSRKKPFAFCIVRIEHLKPYNERYDWGKGDTVVQAVAGIIEDAVGEHGTENDLVGHKWGAQFVILTAPERFEAICRGIIKDFDEAIPFFYDPEDREQGFITGKAPGGATAVFPLGTVSIAAVTSDSPDARSADHVTVAAGRLLEWARTQGGSLLVVNVPD